MIEHLKNILESHESKPFIYPSDLFHRRLKEEILRGNRVHTPFVYLEIPTKELDLFGKERKATDTLTAWKIAVLTVLTQARFIDVKGFLSDDDGIGIIFINCNYDIIQILKRQILRNLREANLLHKILLKPKSPFFRAFYFSGQTHKDAKQADEALQMINQYNEGFFSIEHLSYSQLTYNRWNHQIINVSKRVIDFVLTSLAVVALSPVLLLLALAVKFSDPKGPVIFKQKRVGKNGLFFTMYKFRSMYIDAEARLEKIRGLNETTGPVFKMKNDPRVFPFGRIIRRYSLDELPQLFNILKGDMAIVGPRPPIPREVDEYLPWHQMRLSVKPGLTCHWQVSGRSNITFDEWMRLDNQYVRHGNIATDISLIGKTFKAVIKGDGAY